MHRSMWQASFALLAFLLVLCPQAGAADASVSSQTLSPGDNPDFDAVSWVALGCDPPGDPQGDENPAGTDLVGDGTYPAVYYGRDASYVYFRYRVDGDPSGAEGFAQAAWVALMQTPTGSLFHYQYELALNGNGAPDDYGNTGSRKGDTVEIHQNTVPEDIDFTPLFNDPAEVRLFAQRYDYSGTGTVNVTPLARRVLAPAGSLFGGTQDYFVEFAIPIQALIDEGVLSSASEFDECLFFLATSTNANQYNKDLVNCPFLPGTTLSLDKSVAPGQIPTRLTTQVTFTLVVTNTGSVRARGLIITDPSLPGWMTSPIVGVSSDDPSVTWTVVSSSPLEVRVPFLPSGRSVTVTLRAEATPPCNAGDALNTAMVSAVNAPEASDGAVLHVQRADGPEVCDGVDNNCDGTVDDGGSGLCDDGNPCTQDTCAGGSGCQHAPNTLPCDDGNACTTNDTCAGGRCAGGPAANCDDGNVCTDDGCDPATGCTHANNTDPCSDGNACTTADACSGGLCFGGPAPDCDDGNVCTNDGCDRATGCTHANNTNPCSDGNACTTSDTCSGGTCAGGPPPNCDDGNACTDDTCDQATGCGRVNNSSPCSDGNACTTADTCSGGLCVGGPAPDCDDGNGCTSDSCSPRTGCEHENNTAPCDDGNACTAQDACAGGACEGGPAPDCDDGNLCTDDGCDPATGCTHLDNTLPCNDRNACTTADTCSGGLCVGGPPPDCEDGNVCTSDACDARTGCVYGNNRAACDDGNACTTDDTCSGGTCAGGPAPDCDDANLCTTDSCEPASGCEHENNTVPCSDGNACTTSDTCSNGACAGGPPPNCDDGNVCTNDSCDPATGCTRAPNALPCDDRNACTTNDTCSEGSCAGGPPPICNDRNVCTDDACNPASGCIHRNNTRPCSDGSACTTNDTCAAGVCVGGPPPNCDDGNVCTDDSCSPATGCVNARNTSPCDDGSACTTNDTCAAGVCVSGPPPNCNDGNACTDDSCSPETGCANVPDDTNACSDGSACTMDRCEAGRCMTTPVVCNDLNPCTDDLCDPASGCRYVPDSTNTCSDGNACTMADSCVDGVCTGGRQPDCEDGNSCSDQTCDPETGCVYSPNGRCGGSPRTQGYWKRLCRGPHPSGDFYSAVDVSCINDTCTFGSIAAVADICDRLYPDPSSDKCEQAEAQFMALTLNLCRFRVAPEMALASACTTNVTVGQSAAEADRLLCSPDRTRTTCTRAQCESEEINAGSALQLNTLRVRKGTGGAIILEWTAPHSSSTYGTLSYRIWRRPVSESAWTMVGEVDRQLFTDNLAASGPNWQYEVTLLYASSTPSGAVSKVKADVK